MAQGPRLECGREQVEPHRSRQGVRWEGRGGDGREHPLPHRHPEEDRRGTVIPRVLPCEPAGALEEIKRTVLHELDADPGQDAGNYANIGDLGKVYPLHYESDVTFVYRPETPRPFKYSELTLTDGAGEELDEQKALLNLPMKAAPRARPNIINAAGIVPWAFEEPPILLIDPKSQCTYHQLVPGGPGSTSQA